MTSDPYDHRTEEQRLLDAQEPQTMDAPKEEGAAALREEAQEAVASGRLDDGPGADERPTESEQN